LNVSDVPAHGGRLAGQARGVRNSFLRGWWILGAAEERL
jgi:hypothetical protein